jgi:hypothetical protein
MHRIRLLLSLLRWTRAQMGLAVPHPLHKPRRLYRMIYLIVCPLAYVLLASSLQRHFLLPFRCVCYDRVTGGKTPETDACAA